VTGQGLNVLGRRVSGSWLYPISNLIARGRQRGKGKGRPESIVMRLGGETLPPVVQLEPARTEIKKASDRRVLRGSPHRWAFLSRVTGFVWTQNGFFWDRGARVLGRGQRGEYRAVLWDLRRLGFSRGR